MAGTWSARTCYVRIPDLLTRQLERIALDEAFAAATVRSALPRQPARST